MARRSSPPTRIVLGLVLDVLTFVRTSLQSRVQLAAENMFLRKQLTLCVEREIQPRRADPATRATLALVARLIDWRPMLTVVTPDTLVRWHRAGWRLLWRLKSKPRGRPPIPREIQRLIAVMSRANPAWGEERIADELQVKLGIAVSPRTVRRYLARGTRPRKGVSTQRWSNFIRNHAHAVLACDFAVTVTVAFRVLYVFVVLEVGTRRIVHWNVTAHPTADWTTQQFRAAITGEAAHRFLVHDRDAIFAPAVDRAVRSMGPARPQDTRANAASQCLLRTRDRHDAEGVPGLGDPPHGATSRRHPDRVGESLQSRPATRQPRARPPRTVIGPTTARSLRASAAAASPGGRHADPGRPPPRISPG
jgi:putative transposase